MTSAPLDCELDEFELEPSKIKMNSILTFEQVPYCSGTHSLSELIQRASTLYTLAKQISYLQLFASFIDNKETMNMILCGKNGPHRKWADIFPNFDKQNVFLPVTAGQLFNAKITACKIIQQEVFGYIIN